MCEIRVESVYPILFAKVTSTPNASAYPNTDDGDNHNNEENDPLVVAPKPSSSMLVSKIAFTEFNPSFHTMSDYHHYCLGVMSRMM